MSQHDDHNVQTWVGSLNESMVLRERLRKAGFNPEMTLATLESLPPAEMEKWALKIAVAINNAK